MKLFEISDVVLRDDSCDTGARNCRRLVATYMGPTAGFEIIHGLVDRIMSLVQVGPLMYPWACLWGKKSTAYSGAPAVFNNVCQDCSSLASRTYWFGFCVRVNPVVEVTKWMGVLLCKR